MGRDVNSRVDRRRLARVGFSTVAVAVAVLIAGTAVAWTRGDLNSAICGGDCGASNAVLPEGVEAFETDAAAPSQSLASPADLAPFLAAVKSPAGANVLGDHVGVALGGTDPGSEIVTFGSGAFIPASTTKLLTSFAALHGLDPQQRFTTKTVLDGNRVVLVGGGDPYLTDVRRKGDPKVVRADLNTLAQRTSKALQKRKTASVTVDFDDSLFTGPAVNPAWPSTYVRDNVVTPIGALWVDRGMRDTSQPEITARAAKPAEEALNSFVGLLRKQGVKASVGSRKPAATDAQELAAVQSSTVAQIVESAVRTSDDEAAELLIRHLAIATGNDPSFGGGTRAVRSVLKSAGVPLDGLVLKDGSGLSRENRIAPSTLIAVVRASLTEGRYAAVIDDLPVSGFSGTLAARFAHSGQGWIRAKTGTLTGVHSLAGLAIDRQGRPVVFAVMADNTDRSQPFAAQAAVDKVAAAIAAAR